jgi:hypothetical protein
MVEEVSKVKKYNGRPVKVDLVNYLVGKVKYTKGALWQMSVNRLLSLKSKVLRLRGGENESL